jgi:hypothetical protein
MLSEEWLRAMKADREREIEAIGRARAARGTGHQQGRFRSWLGGHLTDRPGSVRGGAQTGPAATDFSA